jgi:hypothetical protein
LVWMGSVCSGAPSGALGCSTCSEDMANDTELV